MLLKIKKDIEKYGSTAAILNKYISVPFKTQEMASEAFFLRDLQKFLSFFTQKFMRAKLRLSVHRGKPRTAKVPIAGYFLP